MSNETDSSAAQEVAEFYPDRPCSLSGVHLPLFHNFLQSWFLQKALLLLCDPIMEGKINLKYSKCQRWNTFLRHAREHQRKVTTWYNIWRWESHQICYETPINTFIFKKLTTLTSNLHSLWLPFQLLPEVPNYNATITEMLMRENDGVNKQAIHRCFFQVGWSRSPLQHKAKHM